MEQYLCLSLGECFRVLSNALGCELRRISAVVAYVKESGVDVLQAILGREVLGRSTVVTGLNFYLTEPNALKKLMTLGAKVLVYVGSREFHPKLYLVECGDGHEYLIAGSANISYGAITGGNIEANMLTNDGSIISKAKELIEKTKQQSINARDIIEEYEKKRNEILSKLDKYQVSLLSRKPILKIPAVPQEKRIETSKKKLIPREAVIAKSFEDLFQEVSTNKTAIMSASILLGNEAEEPNAHVMEKQEQKITSKCAERTLHEPSSTDEQEDLIASEEIHVEDKPEDLTMSDELLSRITESSILLFDSYKLFHANKYVSFIHIVHTAVKGDVNIIREVLRNSSARIEGKAIVYNVVKGADSLLLSLPELQNIIGKLGKTKNKKCKLRRKIVLILLVKRYGFSIGGNKSKLIDTLAEKGYLIKGKDYTIANMPLLVRKRILTPSDAGWAIITMRKQNNTINVEIMLKLHKAKLSRTYDVEANIIRKLYHLLTLMKDQDVDDEELARELLEEDSSKDTEYVKKSIYSDNVQGQVDLLSSICSITNKYIVSLTSLPRVVRKASYCKALDKIWKKLRRMLCIGPKTLSELARNVGNHRIMEFIIHALSREGILDVRYTGGYTRNTMPKPRKAWSNIPLTYDRKDMAERLLFYLYTTGNETLRKKRKKAFYSYISVSINQKYTNKLCITSDSTI